MMLAWKHWVWLPSIRRWVSRPGSLDPASKQNLQLRVSDEHLVLEGAASVTAEALLEAVAIARIYQVAGDVEPSASQDSGRPCTVVEWFELSWSLFSATVKPTALPQEEPPFAARMHATPIDSSRMSELACMFRDIGSLGSAREYFGALALAIAQEMREAKRVDAELVQVLWHTLRTVIVSAFPEVQ